MSGTQAAGWKAGLPWGVAGLALGALLAVIALRVSGGGTGASGGSEGGGVGTGADATAESQAPRTVSPPDISQMSPEERATRLYNRIMTLHSQGKADSAAFFLPMALQAYSMLPALDIDARYHIGVLDLTGGDAAAALAQADAIRRATPTHLFAYMLRARALQLEHNAAGSQRAYRDFLANESAERARKRPEYDEHAQTLDSFHAEAAQVTAAPPSRGR